MTFLYPTYIFFVNTFNNTNDLKKLKVKEGERGWKRMKECNKPLKKRGHEGENESFVKSIQHHQLSQWFEKNEWKRVNEDERVKCLPTNEESEKNWEVTKEDKTVNFFEKEKESMKWKKNWMKLLWFLQSLFTPPCLSSFSFHPFPSHTFTIKLLTIACTSLFTLPHVCTSLGEGRWKEWRNLLKRKMNCKKRERSKRDVQAVGRNLMVKVCERWMGEKNEERHDVGEIRETKISFNFFSHFRFLVSKTITSCHPHYLSISFTFLICWSIYEMSCHWKLSYSFLPASPPQNLFHFTLFHFLQFIGYL